PQLITDPPIVVRTIQPKPPESVEPQVRPDPAPRPSPSLTYQDPVVPLPADPSSSVTTDPLPQLPGPAVPGPSAAELEAALTRSVRDIFHLLGLLHPQEDIRRAFQHFSSGGKKSRDYSLELLDSMLKKDIKQFLLPLIDDAPVEERLRRCRKMAPALDKALAS
ncbi:MAG: hypothetical protein MUP19_04515, partial [Candidatus Aminicenantes bacterium]|nr:hypothetical protein [Candidatus Aminicenantes bacterium]